MKKRMCAWVWAVLFSCAMFPQRQRMDLQGKWAFKLDVRGNGEESGFATAPFAEEVVLPGTTDTNRKGFRPARTDETTYLTRLHAYVGKAWYKKVVDIPESWKNKVVTLTLERTKPTRVWVDGKEAGSRDGISVRQVYDLSRFLTPGRHEIAVRVDNGESVPGLHMPIRNPHKRIGTASLATFSWKRKNRCICPVCRFIRMRRKSRFG